MLWQYLWYVLAGIVLGFAISTLWEWFFFRRERLRLTDDRIAELEAELRRRETTRSDDDSAGLVPPWSPQDEQSGGIYLESEATEPAFTSEVRYVSAGTSGRPPQEHPSPRPHADRDDDDERISAAGLRTDRDLPASDIDIDDEIDSEFGYSYEAPATGVAGTLSTPGMDRDVEFELDEIDFDDISAPTVEVDINDEIEIDEEIDSEFGYVDQTPEVDGGGDRNDTIEVRLAATAETPDIDMEKTIDAGPTREKRETAESTHGEHIALPTREVPEEFAADKAPRRVHVIVRDPETDIPTGMADSEVGSTARVRMATANETTADDAVHVDTDSEINQPALDVSEATAGATRILAVDIDPDTRPGPEEPGGHAETGHGYEAAAATELADRLPVVDPPPTPSTEIDVELPSTDEVTQQWRATDAQRTAGGNIDLNIEADATVDVTADVTADVTDDIDEDVVPTVAGITGDTTMDDHVIGAGRRTDLARMAEESRRWSAGSSQEIDREIDTELSTAIDAGGTLDADAQAAKPIETTRLAPSVETTEIEAGENSTAGAVATSPPRAVEHVQSYPDNLSQIKGIGRTYRRRLYEAGIFTWHQVANTSAADLRRIVDPPVSANVEEWPERARKLAEQHGRTDAVYQGPVPDDLTAIRGIGKVAMTRLYRAGICTYRDLAGSLPDLLGEIIPNSPTGEEIDYRRWLDDARRLADVGENR